ncbi:MAG: hypothetical protein GY714_01815 [Desulfobacterales bacterium]|nr:hypothetical protein [Desulfobacterales bacterium]
MSLTIFEERCGTKRIRVFCSRISLGQPNIQEYWTLTGVAENDEKILKEAEERDAEFKALYKTTLEDYHETPFHLKGRIRSGRKAYIDLKVKNITLSWQPCSRGYIPDWGSINHYYWFNTYPPSIKVFYKDDDGIKKGRSFSFKSNRQLRKAYNEAVEFYLEEYPQYESFRREILNACPKFHEMKDYLDSKYLLLYGVRPW